MQPVMILKITSQKKEIFTPNKHNVRARSLINEWSMLVWLVARDVLLQIGISFIEQMKIFYTSFKIVYW